MIRRIFPLSIFFYNSNERERLSFYITSLYILGDIDSLAYVISQTQDSFIISVVFAFIIENYNNEQIRTVPLLAEKARKFLATDDEEKQLHALKILALFGEASDCKYGLKFLENESLEFVLAALEILQQQGNSQVVEVVLPYLEHPDPKVITQALKVLTRWGTEKLACKVNAKSSIEYSKESDYTINRKLEKIYSEKLKRHYQFLLDEPELLEKDLLRENQIVKQWEKIDQTALTNIVEMTSNLLNDSQSLWIETQTSPYTFLEKNPGIYFRSNIYSKKEILFAKKTWRHPLVFILVIKKDYGFDSATKNVFEQLKPFLDKLEQGQKPFIFFLGGDIEKLKEYFDSKLKVNDSYLGWYIEISDSEESDFVRGVMAITGAQYNKISPGKSLLHLDLTKAGSAEKICIEFQKEEKYKNVHNLSESFWIFSETSNFSDLVEYGKNIASSIVSSGDFGYEGLHKQFLPLQGLVCLKLGTNTELPGTISIPTLEKEIQERVGRDQVKKVQGNFQGKPYYYYFNYAESQDYPKKWKPEIMNFILAHFSPEKVFTFAVEHWEFYDIKSDLYTHPTRANELFKQLKNLGRLPEHILFLTALAGYSDENGDYFYDGIRALIPVVDQFTQMHTPAKVVDVLLQFLQRRDSMGAEEIIKHLGIQRENIATLKELFSESPERQIFLEYLGSSPFPEARKSILEVWRKHKKPWLDFQKNS